MREEIVPVLILALNTGNLKEEQKILGETGLAFAPSRGSSMGIQEDNFIVLARDLDEIAKCLTLVRDYNQETVLYIDQNRDADLYNLHTYSHTPLGKLRPVSPLEAHMLQGWTQCLRTGEYYSAYA